MSKLKEQCTKSTDSCTDW